MINTLWNKKKEPMMGRIFLVSNKFGAHLIWASLWPILYGKSHGFWEWGRLGMLTETDVSFETLLYTILLCTFHCTLCIYISPTFLKLNLSCILIATCQHYNLWCFLMIQTQRNWKTKNLAHGSPTEVAFHFYTERIGMRVLGQT